MIRVMPSEPVVRPADAGTERPSKTRLKQEMRELQTLGEALAALPPARLAAIELPESLRDAMAEFRRTRTHEGRRRQLQYIGKLMRTIDSAPAREAIAREQLGSARDTLALHRVEHWRDALIAGDEALTRFVAEHPAADGATLRRLARAARSELAALGGRRGRAYRELFQLLKETLPDE